MALVQKSVVKDVPISELKVGDRLLMDIIGYKDRTIMNQGKTLNNRDIAWFREKMKEQPPRLASERYATGRRAVAAIRSKNGDVLVKAGGDVTEEALRPLLTEGFQAVPALESGVVTFVRETKWPADKPYRIDQFNPRVKIETVITINDELQERPEDQTGPARPAPMRRLSAATGAGSAQAAPKPPAGAGA